MGSENRQDEMLKVQEAADRLGVSPSLVYAWCREGSLAHVRLGRAGRRGRIRIPAAELDRLLSHSRRDRHPLLDGL